jgi:hypothetical protein
MQRGILRQRNTGRTCALGLHFADEFTQRIGNKIGNSYFYVAGGSHVSPCTLCFPFANVGRAAYALNFKGGLAFRSGQASRERAEEKKREESQNGYHAILATRSTILLARYRESSRTRARGNCSAARGSGTPDERRIQVAAVR